MADALTICIAVGSLIVDLGVPQVDLRWVHSVQKTEWSETWQATKAGMVALAATVQGSGAGMEPGEKAVRTPDGWTWRPDIPVQETLQFARSDATPDWQICRNHSCATVLDITGISPDGPFTMFPCRPCRRDAGTPVEKP